MFHFCVTAEALPLLLKNSIAATMRSEMLQYGLTYTMQTWSHSIRCDTMRTFGCIRIPDPNLRMSNLACFDIPNKKSNKSDPAY